MALLDRIKRLFSVQHEGDDGTEGARVEAPALHGRRQCDADPRQQEPAPAEPPSLVARIARSLRGVAGDSHRSEDRQRGRDGTSALDVIFGRTRPAQVSSRSLTGVSPFGSGANGKYREFRLTGATDFSGETHLRGSSLLGGHREEERSRDRGLTGSTLFGSSGDSDEDTNNRLF